MTFMEELIKSCKTQRKALHAGYRNVYPVEISEETFALNVALKAKFKQEL